MRIFYTFYVFFENFLPFWRLFGEFPQKLMSCWRLYCAVGVAAVANTVVAGLPSAVDAVMYLLSQRLWLPFMLLPASLFLQGSLLLIASILCWWSCCCFHSCCCWRFCCSFRTCCCWRSCCCQLPCWFWCPYFSWWLCRMRSIGLSEYGYRTVIFFWYRTIRILNIVLANSRNYRTIGYLIKASIYRTIGYRTQKKLAGVLYYIRKESDYQSNSISSLHSSHPHLQSTVDLWSYLGTT